MTKQYVNLPVKASRHHGARITFEVGAKKLGDGKLGETEWWVEPGGSNTDVKYLSAGQRARLQNDVVPNKKNKFRNTVLLPHVGGDTYRVKCSKKGDRSSPKDAGDEIETWRKIYYTVHWMNAACRDTFDAVKPRFEAGFEPAKIEMKLDKKYKTVRDRPQTRAPPSFPYDLPSLYPKQRTLPDKPFHLRIVVLNDIFDQADGTYDTTLNGTKTWRHELDGGNEMADLKAGEWLRRARAKVLPAGRWRDVRAHTVDVDTQHFEVDLSGHAVLSAAIDAGKDVQVEVQTREHGHFCGYSHGNFCVVRINEPGDAQTTILQTFTHEVGHGFSQAVKEEATYDAAGASSATEPNNVHYTGEGGLGPHCATNAGRVMTGAGWLRVCPICHAADLAGTPRPAGPVRGAAALCTMYHSADNHVEADGKFCVECAPRLLRTDLGKASMKAHGWHFY